VNVQFWALEGGDTWTPVSALTLVRSTRGSSVRVCVAGVIVVASVVSWVRNQGHPEANSLLLPALPESVTPLLPPMDTFPCILKAINLPH
jgi:hypothetical protein